MSNPGIIPGCVYFKLPIPGRHPDHWFCSKDGKSETTGCRGHSERFRANLDCCICSGTIVVEKTS